MALSNFLPSSRVAQPGVCTSTTRPAAPFNGQVIYETDTGKTQVWNGSAWVMLTNSSAPPGLELIKTVTVGSGATSVSVSSVFSSTYDNYLVTCAGMTSNVDGYGLKIKLNNTSGSTYYASIMYMTMGASTITGGNDNGVDKGMFVAFSGGNSSVGFSAIIYSPYNSVYTPLTFESSNQAYIASGGCIDKNAASHTGFTLNSYDGATMTGGTIRVYGYRNSI